MSEVGRKLEDWIYKQDFDLETWGDIQFNVTQDFIAEFIEEEIQPLKEKLSQYESGHKGACSTCEVVGELNIELEKRVEGAKNIIESYKLVARGLLRDYPNMLSKYTRNDCLYISDKCDEWLTQNNQTKGGESENRNI